MPSPLDPLNAFSKLFTTAPTTPAEFVDRWVDATTWWVEPMTRTGAAMRDRMAPERLLAELVDGVLGRFGGQRLELDLRGHPVRGLLESLRVVSRDRTLAVIADLVDVDWAGPPLSHLQARARGVRVTPGVPGSVHAAGIDVQGRCDLRDVVAWGEGRTGAWKLEVDPAGHLQAEHAERGVQLTAEPTYVGGRLELELRAARWRGLQVRVPRWLRLTRSQDLPPLPEGMEVVDAHRTGFDVWFRLGLPEVSSSLDLNRLREAIVRGAPVPVG
jgi:hypothetical protein